MPATPVGAPVESKISVLSGVMGTEKLARFRTLKNSALNCALKVSEILGTRLFLKTEKSKLTRPGPIKMLRPALPRKLKHCGKGTPVVPGGTGSQLAVQKAIFGADGIAKHWV